MTPEPRRAVFLDRDGVLTRSLARGGKPFAPRTLAEFEVLRGVGPALARLKAAGFVLVVVTNQPDVARGDLDLETAEAMNRRLAEALPMLDRIEVCYGDGDDRRRKPNPGMLEDAAAALGLDLPASFMVGDRGKDVEAGQRAGCRTVWLQLGWDEPRPARPADREVHSLDEAVDWILAQGR